MTGVKLGDRFLSVGVRDVPLVAALAGKAGLTGQARAVEADAAAAREAAAAVEREGALLDVVVAPWGAFPDADGSFDVALVRDLLPSLAEADRVSVLSETLRVLRPGGRVVVIDGSPRALFSRSTRTPTDVAALQAAGFAAVRLLASTDGLTYLEGIKRV